MSVITLVGYRGTGKSSVAPLLAAALNWHWVDSDVEIESYAGCSIRRIFETRGESTFRELERKTMASLLGESRLVIAAGGGAVLDPTTRSLMSAAGPVVWLRARVQTIAQRLAHDTTTAALRPALSGSDPIEEIGTILRQRVPLYEQVATFAVDTDERSVEEVVEEILLRLKRSGVFEPSVWSGPLPNPLPPRR
ncbi:MAG: shikimate kinase [Planctomycetota bacterium]|nr:MAG: shikimate kinase [Planctomycetota bacterium]